MKFNKMIFLAITLLFVLFYNYFSFNYTSGEINSLPIATGNLLKKGEVSSFYFTSERNRISSLIIYTTKTFYINNENQINIQLEVSCQNSLVSQEIPLSSLAIAGNQVINIPTLSGCKGQKVIVEFKLLSDLPENSNLRIDNQDMNPDPTINTAPRVVYRDSIKGVFAEIYAKYSNDHIFLPIYFGLLLLILLITIVML